MAYINGKKILFSPQVNITGVAETNATQWKGKTWYAYGTSLTATSSGKYAPVVAELSGLKLVNKGIGGGSIAAGNKSVKAAVMNTTDGKLQADLITLEVGANDTSVALGDIYDTSDSTFCGNLNQCIRYLQENTTAQIVVISSTNGKSFLSGGDLTPEVEFGSDNHTKYDSWEATRKVCAINSVPYIPMGEESGLGFYRMNDLYMKDHIHHTDLGGKNLGNFVWNCLKNIPLWYSGEENTGDETEFCTITYRYLDTTGNTIKDSVSVMTVKGTAMTFTTANAESIEGYTISAINPSGTVTINTDITVTFTYAKNSTGDETEYCTITYKYVDTAGNDIGENVSVSVAMGTAMTFTTANAESIDGYTVSSIEPSGTVTINTDITVTITYSGNEVVEGEALDVTWFGALGGATNKECYYLPETSEFILAGTTSHARSYGYVDVSNFVGKTLSITSSEKTRPTPNYANVEGGYAFFLSDCDISSGVTNNVADNVIEYWNNAYGNFTDIRNITTVKKVVPVGAKYLVFSHLQTTTDGGFNGSVIVLD